ncbi:MAG: hypothetical protein LBU36_08110 [Clostridiales bacterium]|nr:hypothetical protein [Clostridiales bacterium]
MPTAESECYEAARLLGRFAQKTDLSLRLLDAAALSVENPGEAELSQLQAARKDYLDFVESLVAIVYATAAGEDCAGQKNGCRDRGCSGCRGC